jgi:hypothetical protein
MAEIWLKDPDETVQYKFDWAPLRNGNGDSDWLDSSTSPQETISSYTLTAESPGLTVTADSLADSNSSVSLKLSGGSEGSTYDVTCQVVTSAGQTAERTARVIIISR